MDRAYRKAHTVCERLLERWNVRIQAQPDHISNGIKFYRITDLKSETGFDVPTLERIHSASKEAVGLTKRIMKPVIVPPVLPIFKRNQRWLKAHASNDQQDTPTYDRIYGDERNERLLTEADWPAYERNMEIDILHRNVNRDWLKSFLQTDVGRHRYQLQGHYRALINGEPTHLGWLQPPDFQHRVHQTLADFVDLQVKLDYLMTINSDPVYRRFEAQSLDLCISSFKWNVDAYVDELNEPRMKVEWLNGFFRRQPFRRGRRCQCHLAIVCPKVKATPP